MIESISSIRHWRKFYLKLIGFVSFFLMMALIMGALHGQALSKIGEVIMILMSLLLVFMVFYTVVRYYKNAPIVYIDANSITFNNSETFFWKDLEKMELSGKFPFKFLLGDPMEGMMLKFFGNEKRYLFDEMYKNSAEIKSFIQGCIIEKEPLEVIPVTEINSTDSVEINLSIQSFIAEKKPSEVIAVAEVSSTDTTSEKSIDIISEKFAYYKGYQLLCFEGICVWSFLLAILFAFFKSLIVPGIGIAIFCSLFEVVLFLTLTFRLYYFGVSDHFFEIRLHNVFWFRKVYDLSNIKEVAFETRYRMPVTLRIITNDFQSKTYPAGSLWSKRWMQLKEDLEKKNIKVRNECVYYEPFRFKLFS